MSGYVEPLDDLLRPLTAADISTIIFKKKSPTWFDRHCNRKKLYARGFPHPFERGLWSVQAVKDWLATAGKNPDRLAPRARKARPREGRRVNAYAPASH